MNEHEYNERNAVEQGVNAATMAKGGWFFMENDVLDKYGAEIGPYGIAVFTVLSMHQDAVYHTCFPSHKRIARLSGMSVTSVKKAISKLYQCGLIDYVSGKTENRPNEYLIKSARGSHEAATG